MILIFCEENTDSVGKEIAQALQTAYHLISPPEFIKDGDIFNREPEWDDLLLIVYKTPNLSLDMQEYITAFRHAHSTVNPGTQQSELGGFIIPIAVDPLNRKPPDPIPLLKSTVYDGQKATLEKIISASGMFLGLALKPGNQRIFISYRATDGSTLARSLFDYLQTLGFNPWLDEAKDNLGPGVDVQETIHDQLDKAALVVLIDTPDATDSLWVTEEINTAIGQLIPILPVVAAQNYSRFIQMRAMGRCATVKEGGIDSEPLTETELQVIRIEFEDILLTAYQRRMRILLKAQKAFLENGFKWSVLDEPKRMYKADRKKLPNPTTIVLSHCLVQDITFIPALKAYSNYIKLLPGIDKINYKLCIYDRERLLSDPERITIDETLDELQFEPVHYTELEILLASNFMRRE